MTQVPAARRTLEILRYLAGEVGPVTASVLARDLGIPRSSAYHLLTEMADLGFVVHYPEEERWGLGVSAFEVGTAYMRHEPLERLARPLLIAMVNAAQVPYVAHLGVLHGNETMYLLKETTREPVTIVTDVGVRLPAVLTATGRAMLAQLDGAQVRALFDSPRAFVSRTGKGPQSLRELRELLRVERAQGFSEEDGFIAEGVASVAVSVHDHDRRPIAAIGLTFRSHDVDSESRAMLVKEATRRAHQLSGRIEGRRVGA